MTRLLIQPAANEEASRNREKTLHNDVAFTEPRYWSTLSARERDTLRELHPTGSARFWGTRAFLNRRMADVTVGDVALFVWENHVRAIGEVGASFRNKAFADELWKESAGEDSFVNVYSLTGLADGVLIPYRTLADVSGGALKGPFMSGRVVDDPALVDQVISGLGIETSSAAALEKAREDYIESRLERGLAVELEKFHTANTTYARTTRSITVHRGESKLVEEYAAANVDVTFRRFTSVAGVSDMYACGPDGAEVIEAKGGASRERVRQAVAQLLHYAPRCPEPPVVRLTALFPVRPATDDIALLHGVGIDCVYRQDPATFTRLEAPAARRAHMRPIWNNALPS
ncbi:hypothetical protein [Saccharothrix hoggarensis]|uniref:Uncharacterized protein n=1 Tax=Saccharothrix hoggarensis TaxID=913853 RepID=A0ABW3QQL2_9PSEU